METTFTEGISRSGIYYQRHGTPSTCPLVMIIGYGGTLATWTTEFVQKLSETFDVIVFDHVGSGRSKALSEGDHISFAGISLDLREILDELGVKMINLLGYSMGGCIALEFYRANQELVNKLILMSTTGGGGAYRPATADIIDRVQNPRGSTYDEMFFDFISISMPAASIEKNYKTLKKVCEDTGNPPTPEHVLKMKLQEFRGFDSAASLHQIQCPVLVIHGNDDFLMPVENAHILTNKIEQAELVTLDDCGHYPHIEQPKLLIDTLAKFLQ